MREAALTVIALVVACGGDIAGDGDRVASTICGAPPPAPTSNAAAAVGKRAYAIRTLYLGDADRQGRSGADAWKSYGFDIDGVATPSARQDAGLCALASGAAQSTHDDGTCGIDNSFGENILPILLTTGGTDYPARMNAAIETGGVTHLIVLDDIGAARDATSVGGALMLSAAYGRAPAWDGTDAWPVDERALAGRSLDSPSLTLAGYVNGRVWVGRGGANAGPMALFGNGAVSLALPLTRVVVSARISDDGTRLLDGTISAVLRAEEAIRGFQQYVDAVSFGCCGGEDCTFEQIRQASDILDDGTQDPNRPCDAISVGLGFEAWEVKLGPIVPSAPPRDLCALDAGSGD